ncbi:Zn-ribbon domain-containing OB-fold protein [Scopulibacillus cellulosilyticus]|uniref:Zn-ribbon domain-containing OB-fold protein n=1 Tax=Scopulibacillus cellulosilyticus TaxID=2665665 RepID=A0ABW2PU05_9BACL
MENQIPKPLIDGDSKPFWDGINRHELWIQLCESCGKHIFYPRAICPHCFSESIKWVQSKGIGKIYSYTVVHRAFGSFHNQTPFVIAIVELDEGVRMMTRILGERSKVHIDETVKVVFEQAGDELTLPYFELI